MIDAEMDRLVAEYRMRYPTANSQRDFNKLEKIKDKMFEVMAKKAHLDNPSLTVEEHKDLLKINHKMGV